jgi:ribosomal protein S18 acetylase RimI-like enzyme
MTQNHPRIIQVPESHRLAAAERLVNVEGPVRRRAARALLENAARSGIDPSLMWASIDPSRGRGWVGQVCLVVPGGGRTAMLFLSSPGPERPLGSLSDQHEQRVGVLLAAARGVAEDPALDLGVAQALPEPGEDWAIRACRDAGMIHVGDLTYLRREAPREHALIDPADLDWGPGVRVRRVGDLRDPEDREALLRALDRSYEQTLDCPELCGLRTTPDVLASHESTGVLDPRHWWIIEHEGEPHGCVLMSRCPDQDALELVYLGLSTALRGRGLGRRLLEAAMRSAGSRSLRWVTCAVDQRNTPAITLYDRLGFRAFTARAAYVLPLDA